MFTGRKTNKTSVSELSFKQLLRDYGWLKGQVLKINAMSDKMKGMIFYTLIIDRNDEDHMRLRNAINRMAPQCFVESIYSEEEAVHYLNTTQITPHLIILDTHLESNSLRLVLYMIRQNTLLKKVPVVLVNANQELRQRIELKSLGVNEFYLDPHNPIEMRVIAHDIKHRWLSPT